jgi:hypothetical protein
MPTHPDKLRASTRRPSAAVSLSTRRSSAPARARLDAHSAQRRARDAARRATSVAPPAAEPAVSAGRTARPTERGRGHPVLRPGRRAATAVAADGCPAGERRVQRRPERAGLARDDVCG